MSKKRNTLSHRARAVLVEMRRPQTLQLIADGYSYREAAKKLGVSMGTVHGDIKHACASFRKKSADIILQHKLLTIQRIQAAMRKLMPRVKRADDDAILSLVRLEDRLHKTLGSEVTKVAHTDPSGEKQAVPPLTIVLARDEETAATQGELGSGREA